MLYVKLELLINKKLNKKFLMSALTDDSLHSIESVNCWLNEQKNKNTAVVLIKALASLRQWKVDDKTDSICHDSGKFFEIAGIAINTNYGKRTNWEQPIINQPEIGILGIISQEINGVLHFLLQAKIEPGNINIVQLSPTLQATKSNYTKVHKGKTPLFLEYFTGAKKVYLLIDQLQSEQGARFLRKRNRNMIVEINSNEKIKLPDNFIWLTLKQIRELSQHDNIINMDTRTVISSIAFTNTLNVSKHISYGEFGINVPSFVNEMFLSSFAINSLDSILSWITTHKTQYDLKITRKNVFHLPEWQYDGNNITNIYNKYFTVIGVSVDIENREIISWDQPMIRPAQEGLIGFITKKINDTYHFLVQAKVEAGNLDILELAPTVQCLTGNYRNGHNEYSIPFINDILYADESEIIHKSMQSEEGGRFYQEQNINIIVEKDAGFCINPPENFIWMSLNQLMVFMKFNNYLNIATRNLISLIPFNK
jgi:dTDP-4-dehydro-6-deoxy-alpha-D-glucopyranose 2,3-dehydratase